jgi:hypothetical protein
MSCKLSVASYLLRVVTNPSLKAWGLKEEDSPTSQFKTKKVSSQLLNSLGVVSQKTLRMPP